MFGRLGLARHLFKHWLPNTKASSQSLVCCGVPSVWCCGWCIQTKQEAAGAGITVQVCLVAAVVATQNCRLCCSRLRQWPCRRPASLCGEIVLHPAASGDCSSLQTAAAQYFKHFGGFQLNFAGCIYVSGSTGFTSLHLAPLFPLYPTCIPTVSPLCQTCIALYPLCIPIVSHLYLTCITIASHLYPTCLISLTYVYYESPFIWRPKICYTEDASWI